MNKNFLHPRLNIAAVLATALALCNCAQPLASLQSGKVHPLVGSEATERAHLLAVAESGPARGKTDTRLETVALFDGTPMPTGLSVSKSGRIFLSFPRWGDKVNSTAVELVNGTLQPFPNSEANLFDPNHPDRYDSRKHLVSIQSVVVDDSDRLWLLDPGSINFAPSLHGAAKLLGYDLQTRRLVKAIYFPNDVALKTSYLNDVRFDLSRGKEGTAYITDSGVGGIIVVDLASGNSWRQLDGHFSVLASPGLKQQSEGQELVQRKPSGEIASLDIRSDGIALSPDKKTLYYNAIVSRDIFAISTDVLANQNLDAQKVAQSVRRIGSKPSGNDGLFVGPKGEIYSTDFEDNAIRQIDPKTGVSSILTQDQRLLWPDTLSLDDGYLYIVSNQLARQPLYHSGKDLRKGPYALFRIKLN